MTNPDSMQVEAPIVRRQPRKTEALRYRANEIGAFSKIVQH